MAGHPAHRDRARDIARFGALFLGFTVLFFFLFDRYQALVGMVYVHSLSRTAQEVLSVVGISSHLESDLQTGSSVLLLGGATYRITQACTGLFTCALYVSGVLACPITPGRKVSGLLIGIPAFFVFGVLRVIIMCVVAVVDPSRIEVFHVYIMAIANLGFAMFVWISWFNGTGAGARAPSVPD